MNNIKTFISPDGDFIMDIPLEWHYKYSDSKGGPHTLVLYKGEIGCLQISCKPIPLNSHLRTQEFSVQEYERKQLYFKETIVENENFYMWFTIVKEKYLFITYILDKNGSKKKVLQELKKIREFLPSIFLVSGEKQEFWKIEYKLEQFLASLGAASDLINRAMTSNSNIELVILFGNMIDALLRFSIILKKQILEKNRVIDVALISQELQDKPKLEKEIYLLAKENGIIDNETFDSLYLLYNERNKVVHRYIISDIRTNEIGVIGYKYWKILEKIYKIIEVLEEEQRNLKVGIYCSDKGSELSGFEKEKIISLIRDKHANKYFNDSITI